MVPPSGSRVREFLGRLVVTGLGTGYLPLAPGTWGSAGACGVFLLAAWGSDGSAVAVTIVMVALALAACVGCVVLGGFAELQFGKKDPGKCTIDEWAGQAVALYLVPLGAGWSGWLTAAGAGFLAFRLFDIVKPPPIFLTERLPRGWGILADDLAAGAFANIAVQVFLRLALGAV